MRSDVILMAIVIAFGFVGWPIIGSYSRAHGSWIGMLAISSTALAFAGLSFRQLINVVPPNTKAIVLLLVAGIINGGAVYLYTAKIADTTVPTAAFVVIVSIFMVIVAPLLNWMLNSAVPSFQQGLGFLLAMAAIYFLKQGG
jgi:drug/metabolite transporter (DMT)-like permease